MVDQGETFLLPLRDSNHGVHINLHSREKIGIAPVIAFCGGATQFELGVSGCNVTVGAVPEGAPTP